MLESRNERPDELAIELESFEMFPLSGQLRSGRFSAPRIDGELPGRRPVLGNRTRWIVRADSGGAYRRPRDLATTERGSLTTDADSEGPLQGDSVLDPPTPLRRNAIAATCLGQQALSLQALEADVEERCRWVSRDGALKGVRGRFEVQHLDHYSNREGADGRGIDEKIGLSSEQIYRKVSGGPDDRVGDTASEGGSDDGDRHKHPEDKNVRHRGWTLQDEACVHLCKADKKGYAEDAIGEWCGHAMAKAR